MHKKSGPGAPASAPRPVSDGVVLHPDTTAPRRQPGRFNSSLAILEIVAQAIATHWKHPSPRCEQASANIKEWVRTQVRTAIAAVRAVDGQ
jgi:hypothetical protein